MAHKSSFQWIFIILNMKCNEPDKIWFNSMSINSFAPLINRIVRCYSSAIFYTFFQNYRNNFSNNNNPFRECTYLYNWQEEKAIISLTILSLNFRRLWTKTISKATEWEVVCAKSLLKFKRKNSIQERLLGNFQNMKALI